MTLGTVFKQEISLNGTSVSNGIGYGAALCLEGERRQFAKVKIESSQIEREIRRFGASVRLAKKQLRGIVKDGDVENPGEKVGIFETHLAFLEDKSYLQKIEETIKNDKLNAEWAVRRVTDSYVLRYKLLSDRHLQEKYIDMKDVGERLIMTLGGGKSEREIETGAVIIAKELNPSTLVELSGFEPVGIVTESGGWTSHTFILARELGIPAVTGIRNLLRIIETGTPIVVNGNDGQITVAPSKFETRRITTNKNAETTISRIGEELYSADGELITIRANIDIRGSYEKAFEAGAKGIGLYRSEFLYDSGFPDEELQTEVYASLGDQAGSHGARIRTFDLAYGRVSGSSYDLEKNQALGLRGIRLGLKEEQEFRKQLRAILRASFRRNIEFMLPMVSDVSEVRRAKQIYFEERKKLEINSVAMGDPKCGVMIEVPSAVFMIDEIAKEVDFLSIGTNDLVQYVLGVDRDNQNAAAWFRSLHPAVLRCIQRVVVASKTHNLPVLVCGEMAGSPLYSVVLFGLGVRELSMGIGAISRVWEILSQIDSQDAEKIASEMLACATADESEELLNTRFDSLTNAFNTKN
ncbi:MAG: phosphoenolpyruvate--protein phosphotransferase [Pyrinomonadaceae bacterium]